MISLIPFLNEFKGRLLAAGDCNIVVIDADGLISYRKDLSNPNIKDPLFIIRASYPIHSSEKMHIIYTGDTYLIVNVEKRIEPSIGSYSTGTNIVSRITGTIDHIKLDILDKKLLDFVISEFCKSNYSDRKFYLMPISLELSPSSEIWIEG